MALDIRPGCDLEGVQERILALVNADERVLDEPAPPAIFVMAAGADSVQMTLFCWVMNENFLGARSDLWLQLMRVAGEEGSEIPLALPRQVVEFEGAMQGSNAGG